MFGRVSSADGTGVRAQVANEEEEEEEGMERPLIDARIQARIYSRMGGRRHKRQADDDDGSSVVLQYSASSGGDEISDVQAELCGSLPQCQPGITNLMIVFSSLASRSI